jgi:hypothetical protein
MSALPRGPTAVGSSGPPLLNAGREENVLRLDHIDSLLPGEVLGKSLASSAGKERGDGVDEHGAEFPNLQRF